jgi:hypothetical protein
MITEGATGDFFAVMGKLRPAGLDQPVDIV